MSCSKKDYVAIAGFIRAQLTAANRVGVTDADARIKTSEALACNMADYFASQSPRFDRARFLKACGLVSHIPGDSATQDEWLNGRKIVLRITREIGEPFARFTVEGEGREKQQGVSIRTLEHPSYRMPEADCKKLRALKYGESITVEVRR